MTPQMTMIHTKCPDCNTRFYVTEDLVQGKLVRFRCRKCSGTIVVDARTKRHDSEAPAVGSDDALLSQPPPAGDSTRPSMPTELGWPEPSDLVELQAAAEQAARQKTPAHSEVEAVSPNVGTSSSSERPSPVVRGSEPPAKVGARVARFPVDLGAVFQLPTDNAFDVDLDVGPAFEETLDTESSDILESIAPPAAELLRPLPKRPAHFDPTPIPRGAPVAQTPSARPSIRRFAPVAIRDLPGVPVDAGDPTPPPTNILQQLAELQALRARDARRQRAVIAGGIVAVGVFLIGVVLLFARDRSDGERDGSTRVGAPASVVPEAVAPVVPPREAVGAADPPIPPSATSPAPAASVPSTVADKPATSPADEGAKPVAPSELRSDANASPKPSETKKEDDKPKPETKPDSPGGDLPPFDRAAASAAIAAAKPAAQACKQPDGPQGNARVSITFAPSGRVTTANVSGPPFAGTPSGGCIASRFRSVTVPPFSGPPVTVHVSVSIF